MKIRITKNIRGDHNFDIGFVGEIEDIFARQLIAADGAVEVAEAPVKASEPEAAVVQPPENAMKKLSPSQARRGSKH